MKGKTYIGKVLLSVVIAMTMVTTAIPSMAVDNDNGKNPYVADDTKITKDIFDREMPVPIGDIVPNGYVLFQDDFATFDSTTTWTITDNGGDGTFAWNETNEQMNWTEPIAGNGDGEDDYLEMTLDLTGLDATCTQAVNLEFAYWGEGGSFDVLADTTVLATLTPGTTPQDANIDLTGYVGTSFTLAFHATDTARNFSIDDVIISYNYTVDIAVNFLEDLTNNGYANTFPKVIKVNVSNLGGTPATDVDFHLQIYREQPFEPESFHCWDLESCFLVTWDTISADGDQAMWYWTEKRSHSPTHSYACKPDNLPSYEANSEDYLVLHDWFHIPTEVDGKEVHSAFLNFSQWVEGEFDGHTPVDYGYVYIDDGTGWTIIGGPYYSTNGEWEFENIDISAYIGKDIKIRFGWFSDDYMNYEGWYIDDICINLGYTSAQPLVFQGYKYVDFDANETKTIQFPIEFTPEKGTYFIQVYTDIKDCVLTNNEVNYTIIFDDICDAAITDITTSADRYEMPDDGYVNIPIQVTVYNNGTLTEDVPVEVKVQQKIEDTVTMDDFESSSIGEWGGGYDWEYAGFAEPNIMWHIDDYKFYSPTHALTTNDNGNPFPAGFEIVKWIGPIDVRNHSRNLDIVFDTTWNFGPDVGVVPAMVTAGTEWRWLVNTTDVNQYDPGILDPFWFHDSSSGWTTFSVSDFIRNNDIYWEINNYWGGCGDATSFGDLCWKMYELTGAEKYLHPELAFVLDAEAAGTAGEGMWIDNVKVVDSYPGATVYTATLTAEDLEPGESAVLNFTWNTTEYGNYIITASVKLDCDQDASNNEMNTEVEIWEQILEDAEAKWCDDNTYGGDDNWHIVEECSLCPQNHFWYNGDDDTGNYTGEMNDTLIIKNALNFTGVTEAYLNFTTKYWIEEDYDYGYVEVSNDSGKTWFILDEYTGNTSNAWQDISIHLLPGTTWLTSPYTGMYFIMPAAFFTDSMKFRFRFFSDALTTEKGWYIDDVNITAYNGTAWNTLFFDDMENGDANWEHMYIWYGCHWHEETTFGATGPSLSWYWNGETRTWLGLGTVAAYGRGLTPFNSMTWGGIGGYYWFGDGDGGFYDGGAPGGTGTYSATFDGSSWIAPVSLDLTYWQLNFVAGTPGITANIDVWDGTTSISTPIPNTAPGVNNTITIDISAMAGSSTVHVSINVTNTAGYDWMGLTSLYINASGPTVPYHQYYNDVDEKLGFEFDLTKAYYAVLTFDQNYSFADGDVGWVEISDDNATWQPILYVVGSSGGWTGTSVEITNYINHEGPTYVRFRFISDHTGTDYGWLVDNVAVWGYVDYKIPTVEATLDPATPDGNFGWYRTPVTVTLTASDNVEVAAIYYSIDGGAYKKYTAPFTIDVDGEHTITYYAVDEVGNPSETGSVSFKLDHTAPTASINVPQSGYIYFMGRELFANPLGGTIIIGGITFQATASDATSGLDYVTFAVDGMTYEKATSPYEIYWHKFDFLPTKYTLTVSAYDIAGNKASDATVDFTHWL